MATIWTDPIVEEVRKVRDAHAAKFDYDIDKIFADMKERQKTSGRKYVSYPPKPAIQLPVTKKPSSADSQT